MTGRAIRFGTDGWRAIIAEEFTFENVRRVAAAAAGVLAERYTGQGVVIGFDRRFLAAEFAAAAAQAVREQGIPVLLADRPAPTPALSWAVKAHGALGALVLTASHNPAAYCGIKVKGAFAGSVPGDITRSIEKRLEEAEPPTRPQAEETLFNPWEDYLALLRTKVDIAAIKQAGLAVYVDVMHGVGAGGLTQLLGPGVIEVRERHDPLFGGTPPEPIGRYLAPLFKAVRSYQGEAPLVGLALDGDADRIAAADRRGNFLSCQVLIPLLVDHLARRRGLTGKVVKTISGSDLIAKVARARHLPVEETAIGFKYIADIMLREPVLLGGEESGGIGYLGHIPERDGLLCALYLLEIVAQTGKELSVLFAELQDELDYHSHYDRRDLKLPDAAFKQKLLDELEASPPQQIAGLAVIEHTAIDGHKFRLSDGRWLLIRFSGTEPLLRLYCEGTDPARVTETLQWAERWATGSQVLS
ncbi:phosphoglucomutase/phosphomannomutase family protein [Gloeobacter kilaueensis]|uniref:Phosphoglucomutase/phosphomannomutase n=1 Tax=Gloeobacter kilaueensis (strain ATCC BAA-2537 / CCAP 1431/1 / ULC 316 / JS1) TaxID=1183438 RepID=U5QGW8_GLOK1|nr:phosphoglucomutase/phosphomannomutase family protein [Gloeobacter kilaueensis]AGY58138.1 phosphoglucomutase/phosphomannomutase [Gloeobacter kilaueensis JS1]